MLNRRTMLSAALAAIAMPNATRADPGMSRISAFAFSFPALSGDDVRLAAYTGKPLLVSQHRLAVRLHAPICRAAGALERASRARADRDWRALERLSGKRRSPAA